MNLRDKVINELSLNESVDVISIIELEVPSYDSFHELFTAPKKPIKELNQLMAFYESLINELNPSFNHNFYLSREFGLHIGFYCFDDESSGSKDRVFIKVFPNKELASKAVIKESNLHESIYHIKI